MSFGAGPAPGFLQARWQTVDCRRASLFRFDEEMSSAVCSGFLLIGK